MEAFKATLEELEYADLLLHVIDLSNPQWAQQAQVVDDLIRELKADHIPCLRVYNKCDLAFSGALPREKDSVYISRQNRRRASSGFCRLWMKSWTREPAG